MEKKSAAPAVRPNSRIRSSRIEIIPRPTRADVVVANQRRAASRRIARIRCRQGKTTRSNRQYHDCLDRQPQAKPEQRRPYRLYPCSATTVEVGSLWRLRSWTSIERPARHHHRRVFAASCIRHLVSVRLRSPYRMPPIRNGALHVQRSTVGFNAAILISSAGTGNCVFASKPHASAFTLRYDRCGSNLAAIGPVSRRANPDSQSQVPR